MQLALGPPGPEPVKGNPACCSAHALKYALGRRLLDAPQREALARFRFDDAGHGFDPLGLDPRVLWIALAHSRFWYERYFRVRGRGIEHLPREGPAILAGQPQRALAHSTPR